MKKVDNAELIDGAALSVKMGFGIGKVNILHLGGVFKRCEYLPVGDTLIQAFESEAHAGGGGEVIVSK